MKIEHRQIDANKVSLHVADASNNPLVASFLADALHHAEDGAYGSCAATGANSPGWNAGAWSAER
ncbi:MAG: hypothetical protein EOO68_31130 [Moraxellaceae bacterium]|nr:MAG: hypothetical protein EOO68_31130 [Moraxellaceae bacterium]